jgi:F-type H+-transporting ATPase subunit b
LRLLLLSAIFLTATLTFAQEPEKAPAPKEGPAKETAVERAGEKTGERAGDAQESEIPHEIWWKWANFAILAGVLGYLAAKNAGPFFASRSAEIQKGIKEAALVKAEAEARAAKIEARIANLAAEIEVIRKNSREEISAEGARISAETAQTISKIQAQAEQDIASAAKTASLDLKAQAAELAIGIAEQQIRARLTQETQDGLVDAFVHDLKRESKAKAALN